MPGGIWIRLELAPVLVPGLFFAAAASERYVGNGSGSSPPIIRHVMQA
jgi:hypothetical protein